MSFGLRATVFAAHSSQVTAHFVVAQAFTPSGFGVAHASWYLQPSMPLRGVIPTTNGHGH
jgi:hypothetical protein